MTISLKSNNSFGVDVSASELLRIEYTWQLKNWLADNPNKKFLILGEGSNILFVEDLDCTVLKCAIKGIKIVDQSEDQVTLEVGAGQNWHKFVKWAVNKGFGGVENLALIPGSVGAAPVQNIGAYGSELSDVLEEVQYFDMDSGDLIWLDADKCEMAYRTSIFKKALNGKAFISAIRINLTKGKHIIKVGYGAISNHLKEKGIDKPGILDVFETVIQIRENKLPDPKHLGNAGSFFKNPVISKKLFEQLKLKSGELPHYVVDEKQVKIPAGWLIDKSGWKGKQIGNVGTYEKQALVLVNHGGASGKEIMDFALRIKASVFAQYGISLEEEVNILPK